MPSEARELINQSSIIKKSSSKRVTRAKCCCSLIKKASTRVKNHNQKLLRRGAPAPARPGSFSPAAQLPSLRFSRADSLRRGRRGRLVLSCCSWSRVVVRFPAELAIKNESRRVCPSGAALVRRLAAIVALFGRRFSPRAPSWYGCAIFVVAFFRSISLTHLSQKKKYSQ